MKGSPSLAWLRPVLAPLRSTVREVLLLSLFVNLLALAVPIFVMQVYDRVVFHAGVETLQGLLIGIAAVLLFDWVLRQCRARILQGVALRIDVVVGRTLFEKILSLPLPVLERQPAAYWHTVFRDVEVVRNTLSGASALMVFDVPFALLFLGLTFVIAEPVAWVLLFVAPFFLLVAWRSASVLTAAGRAERETGLARDTLIGEIVAGRTTVKALAMAAAVRPLWEDRHAECIERAVQRGASADGFANLGQTLTMATTVAMTAVGALAILDQRMTIGALIAANMLSGRMLGVLNQLVGNWRTYAACRHSARRLGEVFAQESERQASALHLARPKGVVTVERVRFAYAADARPVLDGVDLRIEPGGLWGLIGCNGSGKSTLLKLMQGLYRPDGGRVLLDGADIAQLTRAELAGWIGYVPQECVLFAGTLRDNIAHRRPDASDEEVLRAAQLAGAHAFVVEFPDGYATQVGEAGRRLSAGQRQCLAVARALLGDPPILLLDEPTSSLDRATEAHLLDTLQRLAEDHTVVASTHSTRLLSRCPNLIALEPGRACLAGPAAEVWPRLMQAGGQVAADAAGAPAAAVLSPARPRHGEAA